MRSEYFGRLRLRFGDLEADVAKEFGFGFLLRAISCGQASVICACASRQRSTISRWRSTAISWR
jgi:hypothetical protein